MKCDRCEREAVRTSLNSHLCYFHAWGFEPPKPPEIECGDCGDMITLSDDVNWEYVDNPDELDRGYFLCPKCTNK